MSGPELVLHIMDKRPGIKVVYMSGYTGELMAKQGLESGFRLLENPFTHVSLLKALDSRSYRRSQRSRFLKLKEHGMKGNAKVISELNKALREELTAINQYFLHAEMCENWGYHKLSEYIKKQSIGEMKHAEVLIERILFLDGSPSMMPLDLKVGGTVKEMIESDLALEVGAVKQYNDAVAVATKEADNGSRDLLVQLLKDEEDHVDFLEAQLHQIKELGYERYLSMQMGEDEEE